MTIKLFSGTAHPEFAQRISRHLNIPLGEVIIKKFPDSEHYVKVKEKVRGDDVFIIQPTSRPVDENLMELLIMVDALKRSNVHKINVVIPYYGYARQDRRASAREPITAKLIANLLTSSGVDRIITVDLHSPQIVGFFDIDVDHFEAYPVFAKYFSNLDVDEIVAVASDTGFVKQARKFAKLLNCPLAIVDKRRAHHSHSEVMNVIGDVVGKHCVLLDDIIDTAGTITNAANALMDKGAKAVYICATHAVFSPGAKEKLEKCRAKEIVVTDTVPIPDPPKNLKIISIAELMAQVIERIHDHRSLGELFSWEDEVHVGVRPD